MSASPAYQRPPAAFAARARSRRVVRRRRRRPIALVVAPLALASAYTISTLLAASVAESARADTRRFERAANALNAESAGIRETADRTYAMRRIEDWAQAAGFVDGRAPTEEPVAKAR